MALNDSSASIGTAATDAMSLLIEAVEQIRPECWDQPSNLAGWSLRDLVGHVTGSAAKMVSLVEGGDIWQQPSAPADWIAENPVARLRDLAARLQNALPGADFDAMRPSPQGEVPLRYPISDLVLHSWDVHRSVGRLVELPDGLLAFCRGLVESVPEAALRRPGGFGPAQPVPEDATPTTRLMGYLGRPVGDQG